MGRMNELMHEARKIAAGLLAKNVIPAAEIADCTQEIAIALWQGNRAYIAQLRAIDYLRKAGFLGRHHYARGARVYLTAWSLEPADDSKNTEQECEAEELLEQLLCADGQLVRDLLIADGSRTLVARKYTLSVARISQRIRAVKEAVNASPLPLG
jgi:hypothetical protein